MARVNPWSNKASRRRVTAYKYEKAQSVVVVPLGQKEKRAKFHSILSEPDHGDRIPARVRAFSRVCGFKLICWSLCRHFAVVSSGGFWSSFFVVVVARGKIWGSECFKGKLGIWGAPGRSDHNKMLENLNKQHRWFGRNKEHNCFAAVLVFLLAAALLKSVRVHPPVFRCFFFADFARTIRTKCCKLETG